jgi:phosphatidylserine/phosphatidylglycerophosphate/cardiolipin synthase-like enzyme
MAELLTTKETLVALDNIIKRAEKYICIFTFNIKIDENYLTRLRNASKRGVKINIVFGVDNGDPKVIESVLSIPNCTVYFKEQMHAKFFYNEKELLVGSMNLSEASAKNNFELSVLFKNQDYLGVIAKVKEEAKEIINDATEWKNLIPTNERRSKKGEKVDFRTTIVKFKGACIRCKKSIALNPDKPLCSSCYSEWSEWSNEYYLEKYCHKCSNPKEAISFAKPECYTCYKN